LNFAAIFAGTVGVQGEGQTEVDGRGAKQKHRARKLIMHPISGLVRGENIYRRKLRTFRSSLSGAYLTRLARQTLPSCEKLRRE